MASPPSSSPPLSSSSPTYKLVAAAARFSQSALNAVACFILVCLTHFWTVLYTSFLLPTWKYFCSSNLFVQIQGEIVTKMTIEVPAEYVTTPSPASLPVLRLNSRNIDDPLLLDDSASQFLICSSSSDGEEHDGNEHIFIDSELSSGNEGIVSGQLQMQLERRDSDTSDVSSTDGSQEDIKQDSAELAVKIIAQVESMFSDEHLAKDGFLLKHVRRRSDGFVSLKLVAGLRKVKQISREFPVVMSALRKSDKLEVNDEGTKIRRVENLTPYLKALPVAAQNKNKEKLSKSPSSSSGDDLPYAKPLPVATQNKKKEKVSKSPSSSSGDDLPIRNRFRGGSLPIAVNTRPQRERQNSTYLSPNSSPPKNTYVLPQRPKSNSYCEGLTTSATMSPWLQRRKAASRTNSEGNVIISSVLRQPRGPDGTRGFSFPRLPCIPAH